MKNNKIDLKNLKSKLRKKTEISINKNTTIDSKELIVIKNDGSEQKFKFIKIEKMVLWACDNDKTMANILLEETSIKLYNKIKTIEIQEQLIKTAEALISRIQPKWEYVAAKLYLVKLYKDTFNVGGYPNINEYLKRAIRHQILDSEIFNSYTEEELNELNNYIKQNRDFLFTLKGIKVFKKYLLRTPSNKKFIELPQFTYMRVAMALHWKRPVEERIERVKALYDLTSKHLITLATPIMLNAGTINMQLSSCVLNTVADDSISIMDVNKDLAIYSKFKGGTSLDIDEIRASDTYIEGNQGTSSGPVPFVKITEQIMKAWNQGSTRPGANAIYFSFWHYNFEELIVLKNNGGIEENRARGLKYAVKFNRLFIQRYIENKEITLFSPHETPKLLNTYGEEWEKAYIEYEKTPGIMKRKISSRELWKMFMKERTETGNIYLFWTDNVNLQNMLGEMVKQSNLCTEITQVTRASKLKETKLTFDSEMNPIITKEYDSGEVALCNLMSFNLYELYNGNLTDTEISAIIREALEGMDSTFDVQFYPVIEAEYSNKIWRYIGVGFLNKAKLLAFEKIPFDSQEALEYSHELMDDITYKIYSASNQMAKEKGHFPKFKDTEWAKGELPIFKANKNAMKLTEYQPDMYKWKQLAEDIKLYGTRFGLHIAIAPTATSGVAINATPSIEPVFKLEFKEEGEGSSVTLAPDIKDLGPHYITAFNCNQIMLIKAAAIRQIYMDQSQSVNIYFQPPFSLKEQTDLHFYSHFLGLKTLYYFQTQKDGEEEACLSCT